MEPICRTMQFYGRLNVMDFAPGGRSMAESFDQIPLFPLNLVLLPGEKLPLHIFEERYRQMIRFCLETEEPFGILLSEGEKMAEVGCTARIIQVIGQFEDGSMDILVKGEQRFKINQVRHERLYLTADVHPINEPIQFPESDLRERAITQHMKLLEMTGSMIRPHIYQDARQVSFVLANNAGLTLRQKQELLELHTENERISYLVTYFEEILPRLEEVNEVKRRVKSNGHFKKFPPEL